MEHVENSIGRRILYLKQPLQKRAALPNELEVAYNEIPQENID